VISPGQSLPVADILNAFVPLGTYGEEAWSPAGAGVLIVDRPMVWLITAKTLVESAGETPLAAFLAHGPGGTILDIRDSHQNSGLSWIWHRELDLCATLFPLSPAWGLKAFTQKQCAPREDLGPLVPVTSIGVPYGLLPAERPEPVLLSGSLATLQGSHLYSSAPLLAQNSGSPLLCMGSEGALLAGIQTRTLAAARSNPRVPPVVLSEAVCMDAVWDLVRGEQALAQRKHVAEMEAAAEQAAANKEEPAKEGEA
jgi:hypothetical protein